MSVLKELRARIAEWRATTALVEPNEVDLSREAADRLRLELVLGFRDPLPTILYGLRVHESWALPSGFALGWSRAAERQARNYAPSESGGAGAPPSLRPPYVALPPDAISQQAASSRVSAVHEPGTYEWCHEVAVNHNAVGLALCYLPVGHDGTCTPHPSFWEAV